MKKVLLIYPATGWDVKNVSVLLPLSLMYLGRPLRQAGYHPVLIDQRIDPHWIDTIRAHLRGGDVVAAGLSAMTGTQIKWGLRAAKAVREAAPGVPLIWGGVHPSLLPLETAAHPLVDFVVWGEGEPALVDLLDALRHEREPKGLGAVTFMDAHGEMHHGPPRPFMRLDETLIPDYDLVDIGDYITTQTLGVRDLAVTTSRGCPSRCSFCYNLAFANRRWRAQPAEAVVEHVEMIVRRFGINAILVKDDNFFVNRKRVTAIAEGFKERGLDVVVRAECRADYIASGHYDDALLGELRDAGFQVLTVGAESGSEIGLSILDKDITVDDIRTANERLGRAKVTTKFTFMCGFPGESWANIKQTLALMLELVGTNRYARATPMHLYAPYPGTPLFDEAVAQGWEKPATLEEWAAVDFHSGELPWLDEETKRRLRRMTVSTYFLDGRTMPEYFSQAPMMRAAAAVYGAVVRWRARRNNFHLMPELWLMEQYRRVKAMA